MSTSDPIINTTTELAHKPFEVIKYAHVKLYHPEKGHYEQGRITDRFDTDLTLTYRGHETTVQQVTGWSLRKYTPVTSSIEECMIQTILADA